MSFLIDTDVCSAWLKGNHKVWNRFQQYSAHLCISSVSIAELYVWVYRSSREEARRKKLLEMLGDMQVRGLSVEVAERYGQIQAMLRREGTPASPTDLLIASTALVHDSVLVTHNVSDFGNIPDLRVEDWLEA